MQVLVWILRFLIVVVLVWFASVNSKPIDVNGLPGQTWQAPLVFVYPLDGSAKTNTLMLGRGFEQQVSRTTWEGRTLVIVTTQDFPNLVPGQVVSTRVTRSLTLESPTSLVVETTRNGVLGGKESSTKTVYTKG